MLVFAHSGAGHGWGSRIEPWEIHPALTHFPIAFLVGGVVVDLYAWWRGRPGLAPIATGLLITGLVTGVLTALAGLLAFLTVPAHTNEAHRLMYWHLGIQSASLVLFALVARVGWRDRPTPLTMPARLVGWVATVFLLVGSGIGGYVVYHGAAGIEPGLLAPELRGGHEHEGRDDDGQARPEKHDHQGYSR